MSIVQFQCPSCQAPLRLQNRALFVGRMFDCPDCQESLLIEADGSTGVTAKRSPKPTRSMSERREGQSASPSLTLRVDSDGRSNVADLGVDLLSPSSTWERLSRRPAMLGWIVAALLAVVLLIVVNSGRDAGMTEAVSPIAADSKSDKNGSDNQAPASSSNEQNSTVAVEPAPKIPEADTTQAVAKSEPPPIPDPAAVEPPRDDKPAPAVEKPPADEPKAVAPPAPAVLSAEAVEAKLGQKIVRFDQSKPVPFVKVLDTVEELAGVPIVWDLDRVDDEQLQKPVTLQLKQTTVGEILDTLLKQVGLERSTVEGKIELRPTSVPRP